VSARPAGLLHDVSIARAQHLQIRPASLSRGISRKGPASSARRSEYSGSVFNERGDSGTPVTDTGVLLL